MDYRKNKEVLRNFYTQNDIINHFEKDNEYLEKAFNEITDIWFSNLEQIEEVQYLMIAEAPLWGQGKSYIYNPETKFTQFFYKSDLENVLNVEIQDKVDFIKQCNEIGLLIIDISPFALNLTDTIINYLNKSLKNPYGMTEVNYRQLIQDTIPIFFEEKIKAVKLKKADEIKVFFRYARVKIRFQDLISSVFIKHNFIDFESEISEISKQGGGVDRVKFDKIINHSS